jgi:hypothetical protein
MAKEKQYKIVGVLWEDHIQVTRSEIPKNIETVLNKPTLSIGILAKETDKCIMLISDIERYIEYDEGNYIIIYKSSIINMKEFGDIPLRIRFTSS